MGKPPAHSHGPAWAAPASGQTRSSAPKSGKTRTLTARILYTYIYIYVCVMVFGQATLLLRVDCLNPKKPTIARTLFGLPPIGGLEPGGLVFGGVWGVVSHLPSIRTRGSISEITICRLCKYDFRVCSETNMV